MNRPLLARGGPSPKPLPQVKPLTERLLTPGEIGMARLIFAASVQYGRVKVHKGRFLPGTGANAMTPYGEMYFPNTEYREDFSQGREASKILFMHEMVHVWQHQLGRCVLCQGAVLLAKGGYGATSRAYDYDPTLDEGKKLSEFNMEQQGDLIAHYFDARFLTDNKSRAHEQRVKYLPFYERVLEQFLLNPNDASLLPKSTRVWR